MRSISLEELKKSKCANLNPHLFEKEKPKRKKFSKEKQWLGQQLKEFTESKGYQLKKEYGFHPRRKWRFDWCIPDVMIAIEYEGVFSEKSRHTTISGFSGDAEKYNEAQKIGWKVYRYTAITYKNLTEDLKQQL